MYAFGIAHYVRLEAAKARGHEPLELHDADLGFEPGHVERLSRDAEARALRLALAKLPPPQRSIFLLLLDEELGLAQISEILGLPMNTVKSHIHRGKAALKEALAGERSP